MPRAILDENQLHPAIREQLSAVHPIVREVQAALLQHAVVVVGMTANPYCKKARKLLDDAGQPYHYLGYGGYLSRWQDRGALKRWTGWPTLPMVFVRGMLLGGSAELQRLIQSGELQRLAKV